MKRITIKAASILIVTTALSVGAIAQQGQSAPAQNAQALPDFTHPQSLSQDLARLDMALNNTGTLTGRFRQIGSDGSFANGALSLQRPGKIRFEYDDPNPMLIVSDGVTIMQSDRKLGTSDRVPLKSTPLNFFLKKGVSLERDTKVVGLQKLQGLTRVTVRDGRGQTAGNMTLDFNEPNLALRAWSVRDEFGTQTRVELSNLVYNENLDPRLFIMRDNNSRAGRRRQ